MALSIRIGRRVRRIAFAGLAVAAVPLVCVAVAGAATPIVSVGPTASPTGGTATGTVSSNGQGDACLNEQHSGANPSAPSPTEGVQVNDSSCTRSSASGTSTSAATPSASGPDGGGGSGSSGGTTSTSSKTNTSTKGSTVSRSAAGSGAGSSGRTSVFAANARGVLIATIRSKLVQAKAGKRLRVLVTVRDRQNRVVRSAIVSIGRLPGAKTTVARRHVAFSNRKGQTAFLVPVTKTMFGRRVAFRIGARTPLAHALRAGTVLLPKQRPHGKVTRFVASG